MNILASTAAVHWERDMLSKRKSERTSAALMQPLIGGMVLAQVERRERREEREDTLHLGARTVMPCARREEMVDWADGEEGPERDGTMRCFAPREAIQRRIARPMPPRPPAIRYEALGSKVQGRWERRYCWDLC